MWEVCRKYSCGPKIVYELVYVFFSEWTNEIRARKFVPQQLHNFNKKLRKKNLYKKKAFKF